MPVCALTAVTVAATPPGAWSLEGGAANYLDAFTADDTKGGRWSYFGTGVGLTAAVLAKIGALDGAPVDMTVNLDLVAVDTNVRLAGITLRDAANVALAAWSGLEPLSAGPNGFSLTQVYSGVVDQSADWTVAVDIFGDVPSGQFWLDWLNVAYGGTSPGGGGTGPGGQRGQNASILIPLMVQP